MEAESANVTPLRREDQPPSKRGWAAEAPVAPAPKRTLAEELVLVLSLSLLASAAYALLSFTAAPVNRSVSVAVIPQTPRLAGQLLPIATAIIPVWLVFYLLRRNGERPAVIGMDWARPRFDITAAALLALLVGAAGVLIYIASVRLGHNRLVVPVPPLGLWWTIPVLVLSAAQNAILEEVVVI